MAESSSGALVTRFGSAGWSRVCGLAVVAYLILTFLLAAPQPGIQYDEALFQHGAVHMLVSKEEPGFAHDKGSWVRLGGRFWPVMALPYAGTVQDYVLWIPFAVFGPNPLSARMTASMLAAMGIWGMSVLLRRQVSGSAGAAAAWILALHPAYVAQTVFNNSGISVWMAAAGLGCLALNAYLSRPGMAAAAGLGLAAGVGLWGRLNFAWFLAAGAAAALAVLGRRALVRPRHAAAMLLGGAAGSAPLIVYEWISGGGTFKSLAAFAEARPPGEAVRARLAMLGEVLISDGQYRAIWNGPASLPGWVMWAAGAVACAALFSAAARTGDRKVRDWHRVVALWFGLLAAAMIFSSLRIAQHHLATLIPLAAASAGIAASRWAGGKLRWVLAAAGAVYLAAACYWNVAAIEGIRRTGGAGAWSDAIYYVGAFLQTHGRGREVVVLDWGLNNNLYVASGGRVRSVELFWGATREHSSFGRPWRERAGPGTLALVGAGANRVFTAPGEGFLAAAYASGLPVRRVRFFQRSGEPYAEAIEIGAPGQTGGERFEMRDPAGRLRAAAEW